MFDKAKIKVAMAIVAAIGLGVSAFLTGIFFVQEKPAPLPQPVPVVEPKSKPNNLTIKPGDIHLEF